jgi:hypothetical protein
MIQEIDAVRCRKGGSMKVMQVISGTVLALLGAVFCIFSLKVGLGDVNTPGGGLFPFGAACLLIFFSIASIIESLLEKKKVAISGFFSWHKWKPLLFVLLPLSVCTLIMDAIGFIPVIFLVLLFMFKISEMHSWKKSAALALATTLLAYLIFVYFLKVDFPGGFLFD